MKIAFLLMAIAATVITSQSASAENQWLRFMPPASNTLQQGFIRITNTTNATGTVTINGLKDTGEWGSGSVQFELGPLASLHVNSTHLEQGSAAKGLTGALGSSTSNWQLVATTDLDIDFMGFIRTTEGFMTAIYAIGESDYGLAHTIKVFNPGANTDQVSRVRLINTSSQNNTFTIRGVDDAGVSSSASVNVTLGALETREVSSAVLEQGLSTDDINGALGDGTGKWRLEIISTQSSVAMSLLEAPGGYLSNLSSDFESEIEFNNLSCDDIDGAGIFSQDTNPIYLGFLGSASNANSIYSASGVYGPSSQTASVLNPSGSTYSASSTTALLPPVVIKDGKTLFYLSANTNLDIATFSLTTLADTCNFSRSSATIFGSPN